MFYILERQKSKKKEILKDSFLYKSIQILFPTSNSKKTSLSHNPICMLLQFGFRYTLGSNLYNTLRESSLNSLKLNASLNPVATIVHRKRRYCSVIALCKTHNRYTLRLSETSLTIPSVGKLPKRNLPPTLN